MGEVLNKMDLFALKEKKLTHGDKWGSWTYDAKKLELVYGWRRRYGIRLEECGTPGGLLIWLYQLLGKRWLSDESLRDLLNALDDILQVRSNLVDSSIGDKKQYPSKSIGDMKEHLSKRRYTPRTEDKTGEKVKSEYMHYNRRQDMAREEVYLPPLGSTLEAEQVILMIKKALSHMLSLTEELGKVGTGYNRLENIIAQMSYNEDGKWE